MVDDPGETNSSGGYVASIASVSWPDEAILAGTSAATEATFACVGITVVGNVVVGPDGFIVDVVVDDDDEDEEHAAAKSATAVKEAATATRPFERVNIMYFPPTTPLVGDIFARKATPGTSPFNLRTP
jgi:hypothetical protein